jgi:hypothetical protein
VHIRIPDGVIGVPAALHQHHLPAGALNGLLQRLVHGQRMRLGVERKAAHEQHHQCVFVRSEAPAGRIATTRREYEILGVNTKRNDRQLGQDHARNAEPGPQVIRLRIQKMLHMMLDGGRGANERVPGLHRCRQKVDDRVGGVCRSRRVGDAGQTPALVTE